MVGIAASLKKIGRGFTRLIQLAALLAAAIMVSSLILGVVYRYVLQDSLAWSDELALLSFTWLVFLTAALAVEDNTHVRIELIEKVLPAHVTWLLEGAIWIAIALTGVYMVWTGSQFIEFTIGQTSPAVGYPIWMRNVALPVSGALIAIYALANLRRFETFDRSQRDSE